MLASHFTIIKDSWSFLVRKPLLYLHQPHNRQDFNLIKKKKKCKVDHFPNYLLEQCYI